MCVCVWGGGGHHTNPLISLRIAHWQVKLVRAGASLSARTAAGRGPLSLALEMGSSTTVKTLGTALLDANVQEPEALAILLSRDWRDAGKISLSDMDMVAARIAKDALFRSNRLPLKEKRDIMLRALSLGFDRTARALLLNGINFVPRIDVSHFDMRLRVLCAEAHSLRDRWHKWPHPPPSIVLTPRP